MAFWNRKKNAHRNVGTKPRLSTPLPTPQLGAWNYDVLAGPIYTEPIEQAVLRPKFGWPMQPLCGYAYPFMRQFRSIQPPPLFAPKGVTIQGIGIQMGSMAIVPASDAMGEWQDEGDIAE